MTRTSTSVAALVAAALVFTSATSTLHAEPSAANVATAKSLLVQGREASAKGDHKTARDRFKAAWALVPTPIIGMELARAHVALGELIEGREVAIEVTKLPENAKESTEGKAARVEAAKLANDVKPRIGEVTIKLTGDENTDASVFLDGERLPSATLNAPRKINPGAHELTVRVANRPDVNKSFTIADGESREVSVHIEPVSSFPSAKPTPRRAESAAQVAIGGTDRTLAYLGLGVVAVGVAGFFIGFAVAGSQRSTLRSDCGGNLDDCNRQIVPPEAQERRKSAINNWEAVQWGSAIVAGLGAAVAIYGFTRSSGGGAPSSARLEPAIGLGWFGAHGTF